MRVPAGRYAAITNHGGRSMAGQLRIGTAATLIIGLLGIPIGLLWTVVAPRTAYVIVGGKPYLGDPEAQTWIAADGWFAVLTGVAGLLCGLLAYVLAGRFREMGLLVALAVGGAGASVAAWRLGHGVGLSAFRHVLHAGHDGATAKAALDLHASGVVIMWPLLALVAFGLLEALDVAGRESRRRAAASDLGGGGAAEADQVGGSEFDLQATPPGRDVDRGES